MKALKLEGKKFGRLLVLERHTTRNSSRRLLWKCRCECGGLAYPSSSDLTTGNTKSCGCYKLDESRQRLRKGSTNISGQFWCDIKIGAKKRGHEFNITIEYAQKLLENQKFLCNLSKRQIICQLGKRTNNTASLDRIDNNKGYIEGNVQWVHKDINFMKQDLNQEDFINYCVDIACKSGKAARLIGPTVSEPFTIEEELYREC